MRAGSGIGRGPALRQLFRRAESQRPSRRSGSERDQPPPRPAGPLFAEIRAWNLFISVPCPLRGPTVECGEGQAMLHAEVEEEECGWWPDWL